MPRDTAGNYNLPAGNPVASGEIISASWANSTMGDLGQTLSASLDRYGRGGMLAPFQFTDGTEAAPGATWSNEPTTGFYRAAYGDVRMSVVGQDSQRWTDTSSYLWRNGQWEEILTSSGGSGGTTINDLVVTGSFTSPGIDDNATSTAITIDGSGDFLVGSGSKTYTVGSGAYELDIAGGLNLSSGRDDGTSMTFEVSNAERMRIDAGGNVGIGDTTSYLSAANRKVLHVTGGSDGSILGLKGTTGDFYIHSGGSGYTDVNIVNRANGNMTFLTDNSEAMRIDSTGNVGVGESNPDQRLHVTGTTSNYGILAEQPSGYSGLSVKSTTSAQTWSFIASDNGADSDLLLYGGSSAGTKMTISSSGNVGIGTSNTTVTASGRNLVVGSASGNNGLTIMSSPSHSGSIHFGDTFEIGSGSYAGVVNYNHTDNSMHFYTEATERMAIDNSGNLLVGRSSAGASTTDSGVNIYASGTVYQYASGTGSTDVHRWHNGAGTKIAYMKADGDLVITGTYSPSDERLKENIVDAPVGNIDALQVRSYDWKDDGSSVTHGFVAQELEAVAPYAVTKGETEDDMWGVDYSKLVPMLVKEIQDLKAEVAALKGA